MGNVSKEILLNELKIQITTSNELDIVDIFKPFADFVSYIAELLESEEAQTTKLIIYLPISATEISKILHATMKHERLRTIIINRVCLQNDALFEILKFLQNTSYVTTLCINSIIEDATCVKTIGEMLTINKSLQSLTLRIFGKHLRYLKSALLTDNTTLISLSLNLIVIVRRKNNNDNKINNNDGDDNWRSIAPKIIEMNRTLSSLKLSINISSESSRFSVSTIPNIGSGIANALSQNSTLKSLYISQITSIEAILIFNALKHNSTLQSFHANYISDDFSENNRCEETVINAFTELLRENNHLQTIDLTTWGNLKMFFFGNKEKEREFLYSLINNHSLTTPPFRFFEPINQIFRTIMIQNNETLRKFANEEFASSSSSSSPYDHPYHSPVYWRKLFCDVITRISLVSESLPQLMNSDANNNSQ